jgi:hypothetical protein
MFHKERKCTQILSKTATASANGHGQLYRADQKALIDGYTLAHPKGTGRSEGHLNHTGKYTGQY